MQVLSLPTYLPYAGSHRKQSEGIISGHLPLPFLLLLSEVHCHLAATAIHSVSVLLSLVFPHVGDGNVEGGR